MLARRLMTTKFLSSLVLSLGGLMIALPHIGNGGYCHAH
jgi:hypothetical protein